MPANNPIFPLLPVYGLNAGIRTDYGVTLPIGTRVTYVRSTGVQTGDPQDVAQRLLPTLNAALAECRPGAGDVVYVLPGHTESVATATFLSNLVAGTKIIGLGDLNRDDAPTFTWTAAAATWAISVKNVYIAGLRLLMDGFNGVTKAINITAPGCTLTGNFMRWSSGAANIAAIAVEVGSTATDCVISGNNVYGVAAGVTTNGINVVGATPPDRLSILGNVIQAACVAANGLINVTVAAVGLTIANNVLYNRTATSTTTIAFANVASDGVVFNNFSYVTDTGQTPATAGIKFAGTNCLVAGFQNFATDTKQTNGAISPAIVT